LLIGRVAISCDEKKAENDGRGVPNSAELGSSMRFSSFRFEATTISFDCPRQAEINKSLCLPKGAVGGGAWHWGGGVYMYVLMWRVLVIHAQ